MTNEEAIEVIEQDIPCEHDTDLIEALNMAIAALKAEPCDDAVSRQAMLDGLANIAKAKAKSDAQKSLMGRVMFFTEQLPPVTPKPKMGKWIKMPLIEAGQTYSHECSLCGRRILITDVGMSEFPYCHCGAKMEGE